MTSYTAPDGIQVSMNLNSQFVAPGSENKNSRLREWEQAEISRSAVEAARTDPATLRDSEKNIARYLDPPADTAYPLEYAFHLLGDMRGQRVLEAGCGSGENSLMLAHRGARVLGLDISASLISVARERMAVNDITDGVTFMIGSAHDLPLENDSVDVIFGIAILHHLELPLVAREIKRVLRKGGRAIFQEPVSNSKVVRTVRRLIPYRSPEVSPFERPLTDSELEEFADGFTPGRSRVFVLPQTLLLTKLPVIGDWRKPLAWQDRLMMRAFPALRHYALSRVFELIR